MCLKNLAEKNTSFKSEDGRFREKTPVFHTSGYGVSKNAGCKFTAFCALGGGPVFSLTLRETALK